MKTTPLTSAHELGLHYLAEGDKEFKAAWALIPEVSRSGKVEHVMFGTREGVEVTAFQHTMMVQTGQAPITVIRSIFSCETPVLPRTVIRRRTIFGRLFKAMGLWKGLLTGDARFDLHFRVDSEDEAFARALLNDPLRAHILRKHDVTWRLQDARLCLIYSGKMRGERVPASFERLLEFDRLAQGAFELFVIE